jgi:uncharacterized protein YunC (DUF1805 family)
MVTYKKIKIGKKSIHALSMKLGEKNLIVLRGSKGYVMCGYLNLDAAEKFKEAAVKIVKVATIKEALNSEVFECSFQAKRLGICKKQAIKDVLKIIA